MGILRWIFNKILVRKLKNDPEFLRKAAAADKSMENLQKSIRKAEEKGIVIPPELKKHAGL